MKFELKDFQVTATKALLDRMLKARDAYYRDGDPTSCCLASPTGSGKTIMVAAAVEAIFNGNPEWGIERDPFATVLWVSDSPSLNEQTIYKFREATDLDPTLIETIENTFTGDHDELEPGHIYFLNRQKLSSAGLLTKGGEIPTFWQLLRRTVNDSSVHLYMLYDEAHKGLGSADKKDTAGETITSRIIDGDDGKCPIPVVVGISATPKRFTAAMEGRSERIPYPVVKVSPADVQASGLLKDKIVLQAPTEGAAVYNIYLNDACKTLVQSTALWQMYCEQNDAPMVRPLMVVQVPNKISQDIANARRRGDVTLSPSVTNAFFRQQILLGMEPLDINVEIAAAAAVPEIVEAVKQSARTKLEKLTEEYDPVIAKYPTSVRNQFSSGMSKHGIPHTVFLDKPVADTQDSGGKKYSKHVVNDPKTHMAWFNLYDSEDAVVMHELRKPEVICWYRNPVGKTTGQSLRIPYRLGDDRKVLHPDFIFFEKVGDREMPAIVDPHGLHLADTMPKLKGIARYVEDFGESFSRYWFVSDYKGQATYLDMKDAETRSVISTASDAYECFAKCGKKYMDGPLSKSKDGYRKK